MDQKNTASLKSIAAKAGVSITTVHRALTGKKDCSDAMREKIIAIAMEDGYRFNYYEARLMGKGLRIASIMMESDSTSRMFTDRIRDGYEKCKNDYRQYRIDYREYYFNSDADLDEILNEIAQGREGHFDGLIAHIISASEAQRALFSKIMATGCSIMFIENNPAASDIPTVGCANTVAGALAGELISKMCHSSGRVYLLSRLMAGGDEIARAAKEEISRRRSDLDVIDISSPLLGDNCDRIRQLLADDPVAIYATSARQTARVLSCLGAKKIGVFIGSELFQESRNAIRRGQLDAIIDKRPEKLGYMALKLVLEDLFGKESLKSYFIAPRLVLRANCPDQES